MIAQVISLISIWAIPAFLIFIPVYGAIKGVKVYESFVEGAKEGFQVAVRIIPFLVGILVAIGMFRASGAISWMIALSASVTVKIISNRRQISSS